MTIVEKYKEIFLHNHFRRAKADSAWYKYLHLNAVKEP